MTNNMASSDLRENVIHIKFILTKEGKYYEQVHGVPIGYLISLIVAIVFMEEFESKPSALPLIHPGFDLGMLMTLLSSKRQNTASTSYTISIPLTHTYSSPQRFPTAMDPFHIRIL